MENNKDLKILKKFWTVDWDKKKISKKVLKFLNILNNYFLDNVFDEICELLSSKNNNPTISTI